MAKTAPQSSSKQSSPKAVLDADAPQKILLIEDNEFTFRERFEQKYLQKFSVEQNRAVEKFDGRVFVEKDIKKFEEATLSLSLFSEQKIISFTYIDKLSAALLQRIIDVILKSESGTSFLLVGSPLQERSVARKKIAEKGVILTFAKVSAAEFRRFIVREFASYGVTDVPEQVVEALQRSSLESVDTAAKQIYLVSMYCELPKVTMSDLKTVLKISTTADTFKFIDNIFYGNKNKATLDLNNLLESGSNIFGLISLAAKTNSQISALHAANNSSASVSLNNLVKQELAISPWIANKLSQMTRSVSEDDNFAIGKALLKADIRLKSKSVLQSDILQGIVDWS